MSLALLTLVEITQAFPSFGFWSSYFLPLTCLKNLISHLRYCQAQGPTLGPTQGRVKVKVKVRTWSGHGQVRSNSNSNSNSKVGPELYTKIGFHSPPTHPLTTTISKWVLERRVLSKSCLYHHDGPQNDQGWSRMTSGWPQDDLRMTWLFSNSPC